MTFLIIGPIGTYIGEGLGIAYMWVFGTSPIIAGSLVGALWQVLVIFGLHWGLVPIGWNNLSVFGYNTLSAFTGPSNFAQAGAALGVFLKTKKPDVKAIAGPAAVTGILGITEPAVYGVTLKYKKPFVIACIAGAIGGGISAMVGASAKATGIPGLLTLPIFAGEGFVGFLIGIVVVYIFSATATYFFEYKDEEAVEVAEKTALPESEGVIYNPIKGTAIKLSEMNDQAFASEAMGKGLAILPTEGKVCSPVTGEVVAFFPTKHAIGIKSDTGVEILIHVGINTVELSGQFFSSDVKVGMKIKRGQLLLTFDLEKIKEQGYDFTTALVITNTAKHQELELIADGPLLVGTPVIKLT